MKLETTIPDEEFHDFCLWPYEPMTPPAGKLRPINVLMNAIVTQPGAEKLAEVIYAIRDGLGDTRSVWGIKQDARGLAYELYFYDYARLNRTRSIPRVLEIIRPWFPCDIKTSEAQPYFMFSLDLDPAVIARRGTLDDIQMYIGNPGSSVSSGICYEVRRESMRLKNFYFFFDAKKEVENIIGKLTSSAFLSRGVHLDEVLLPQLRDCKVIVVANKPAHDGVYFSGINVDQLLFFLKFMRYPQSHIGFVEQHRDRLDHLLYDVGLDFRTQDGRLTWLKSAYYASF